MKHTKIIKIKKLLDYNELEKISNAFFGSNTISNNYLLPEKSKSIIISGKLHYFIFENNLLLFSEHEDYYKMYYQLNDLSKPFNVSFAKPVVIEILYKGENTPNTLFSYLENCSFKKHILRRHMFAKFEDIKINASKNLSLKVLYTNSENEIQYINRLMRNTFDIYTGDILSYDGLKEKVQKKELLCTYIGDEICGFISFEINRESVYWGHFAIDERFRGMGIANQFMDVFFNTCKTSNKTRFRMWVVDDNSIARSLYEKIGFKYDNKNTQSMLSNNH